MLWVQAMKMWAAQKKVRRDLLKTALLGALSKRWDERVREWKKEPLDIPCQWDGVPMWWIGMRAAAGRRVGLTPASARVYLWQRFGMARWRPPTPSARATQQRCFC